MQKINTDAIGEKLYQNFDEDISSATTLTMKLKPEQGDDVDVTPILGTTEVNVGDETFLANQYVYHTTTSDQFEFVGRWEMKSTAKIGSVTKSTRYVLFRNEG